MLTVGFSFPAGRYHATPWGRHVNEADVEWPPAPWRILRARIATWHRKADPDRHPEPVLQGLVDKLAASPPRYRLPAATRAHSRHYMPVRSGKGERRVLVFDGFVRVEPSAELVATWPDTEPLGGDELALLDELLRDLGFLGRAESWASARRIDGWQGEATCVPSELSVDARTGDAYEPIRLLAPQEPAAYASWRDGMVTQHGLDGGKLKKAERRLLATLPERLIDALRLDTSDIQAVGWSRPPGAQYLTYQRPYGCFTPQRRRPRRARRGTNGKVITTARLALAGKPLPRIEDAVRIGEITRWAAMSKAERFLGEDRMPATLSGHGAVNGHTHGHAFYLPEANPHGRIDHILIHARDGLDRDALRVLDRITRLWEDGGGEWQVLLEGYGSIEAFGHCAYTGRARTWMSATPYLHPWHRKKKFTVEDQIRRECGERGLPEPELERLPSIRIKSRHRRPVHFYRFRRKRGLTQPDTQGGFWRLTFPKPIDGPLALGFGCHFGLGLFRRADELVGAQD